jgi:glucose/arabinose dehydrogenase
MILRWLKSALRRTGAGRVRRKPARLAPRVEALEQRDVPAALLPPGFTDTTVVKGLTKFTTAMQFAPDGRLFVAQQNGQVRVIDHGQLLATPFLTVNTHTFLEFGLEGFTLDPNFESNGYVYVYYTVYGTGRPHERISRFTASAANPDVADPSSEAIILDNIPTGDGLHQGGAMHFGPDGMLYIGIGDTNVKPRAQSLHSLAGKILRLDVANYPNVIPRHNPFVHVPGAQKAIFAVGFRNPFTAGFDPANGKFYVNDVGENTWEEVDRVRAGHDYGWPDFEGPSHAPGFVEPIYAYRHGRQGVGKGAAITGGVFYTGNTFPAQYSGKYFFSDYVNGFIRVMDPNRPHDVTPFASGASSPIQLAVGPDGGLYYLNVKGEVHEIQFAP